jgi:uncharacterized membrane protein YdfJ with MMPL/SSD domain
MVRLDGLVSRRRCVVLGTWLILVGVAVPFALRQSDRLTAGGFQVPGSQSERVERIVTAGVPVDLRPTGLAAVLVHDRPAARRDYQEAMNALASAVRHVPGVTLPRFSAEAGVYLGTHRPGLPALVPLDVTADEFHSPDVARELRTRLAIGHGRHYGAVRLHLVGAGALWAGLLDVSQRDLASAERLGLPVVLLILLGVFGSLTAAALPLALGAVAVAITGALIYWLSGAISMNFFVPNMASMIGLGVAVDYSLFVVVRYREELRAGSGAGDARRTAMATSGLAVLFSGVSVVIALAGLLLVNSPAVRSLALGAILVVLVAMLACATLLPALLSVIGHRPSRRDRDRSSDAFARWASLVMGKPAVTLAGAVAILMVLALPALGLRTGDGALRELPKGDETRVGLEDALRVEPVGRATPLKILVAHRDLDHTVRRLLADPEVAVTAARTQTRDRRWVLVLATPRHQGDSREAKALVERLRAELPRGSLVGGDSAAQVDFDSAVRGAIGRLLAWILVLTFLTLVVFVRSLPLAIVAVIANLLSVAAAFGVLTVVFVRGWFDGPLGLHAPGYVDTLTVPLVTAVVFGLSMDYEVFLLSRIRERYVAMGRTRDAVRDGLSASGRTISGAALIMVAVFGAFALTGVPAVKEVGLGAVVAIAVDATVVRLALVPAVMALLGERCWSVPWADRVRVSDPQA